MATKKARAEESAKAQGPGLEWEPEEERQLDWVEELAMAKAMEFVAGVREAVSRAAAQVVSSESED